MIIDDLISQLLLVCASILVFLIAIPYGMQFMDGDRHSLQLFIQSQHAQHSLVKRGYQ
jgi:hypothetical protein